MYLRKYFYIIFLLYFYCNTMAVYVGPDNNLHLIMSGNQKLTCNIKKYQ